MKKIEIPHAVLSASDKCPHNYICLHTGCCEDDENCLADHTCGEKNIIFLKDIELSAVCPYRDKYDCQQVCLCPTKLYLHKQRIDGGIPFKQCTRCKKSWNNYSDFLSDPSLSLHAYQKSFMDLETGVFLFEHACKTTLAIPAGDFSHLYDGPIFSENNHGIEKNGYCLRPSVDEQCPGKCECAYIYEIMTIINQWPKTK